MKRMKLEDLPPPDPSILQDMLQSRCAPGTKGTDRAFLEGRLTGYSLDHMDIATRTRWQMAAKAQGVSLSGKVLCSGLTEHEYDCRAWVDSRGEQKKRCEELGRSLWVNGECVYSPPEQAPKPEVKLAKSIVEREVNRLIKNDPGLKKVKRQELRERVIDKHAPKRGKE